MLQKVLHKVLLANFIISVILQGTDVVPFALWISYSVSNKRQFVYLSLDITVVVSSGLLGNFILG